MFAIIKFATDAEYWKFQMLIVHGTGLYTYLYSILCLYHFWIYFVIGNRI